MNKNETEKKTVVLAFTQKQVDALQENPLFADIFEKYTAKSEKAKKQREGLLSKIMDSENGQQFLAFQKTFRDAYNNGDKDYGAIKTNLFRDGNENFTFYLTSLPLNIKELVLLAKSINSDKSLNRYFNNFCRKIEKWNAENGNLRKVKVSFRIVHDGSHAIEIDINFCHRYEK